MKKSILIFLCLLMASITSFSQQPAMNDPGYYTPDDNITITETNDLGLEEPVAELRENSFEGGYDVYEYNSLGLPEQTGEIRPDRYGGATIYNYNDLGLPERTGTIQTGNNYW